MKMDNQVRSNAILTVAFAATLACSANASAAILQMTISSPGEM
jgi:hypothetical protein